MNWHTVMLHGGNYSAIFFSTSVSDSPGFTGGGEVKLRLKIP